MLFFDQLALEVPNADRLNHSLHWCLGGNLSQAVTKGFGSLEGTAKTGEPRDRGRRLERRQLYLGLSDPWLNGWLLLLLFVDALMGGHNLTG